MNRVDGKHSSALIGLRSRRGGGRPRRVFAGLLGNLFLGFALLLVDLLHRFAGQFLAE